VPKGLLRIICKHNAEFHFALNTKDNGGSLFFLVFSVAFTKGSGGGFIIAESSVEGMGGTSTCQQHEYSFFLAKSLRCDAATR
jgi:hypothetical protein